MANQTTTTTKTKDEPMGQVRQDYFDTLGTKLPSVTTILGRFKESGGLIYWAFKEGCTQGEERGAALANGQPVVAFNLYRDKAADAGTIAHELVHGFLRGLEDQPMFDAIDADEMVKGKAISAYGAFQTWMSSTKIEVNHAEVPLVSERYKFGGRLDAIGTLNGQRILLDWKTSNSVYVDYTLQLAAYKQLWDENYPDRPIEGGMHLLRFAKTEGDFGHHHFPQLDQELVAFLKMRDLFDLTKQCEKRVK